MNRSDAKNAEEQKEGIRLSLFDRLRRQAPDQPPEDSAISVARRVAIPFLSRLLTDTGTQIWFPFLPFLASGMGMTATQLSRLLGVRNLCGSLAPVWGALADRHGYLKFLRLELLAAIIGYMILTLSATPALYSLGVIIVGIATLAFVPTMVAWVSTRFPYRQRGRALGMLEYAWAVSGIACVPLAGMLLETYSWKTPFWMLAGGLAVMYLLFQGLPGSPVRGIPAAAGPASQAGRWDVSGLLQSLWTWIASIPPLAWSVIGFGFVLSLTLFNLLFVFGGWLTEEYRLTPIQLGGVVMGMGLADLVGSVTASLFMDRLGKVRSLQAGGVIVAVAFGLLSVTDFHFIATMANLVLLRCGLEFTIVSLLAYASEIMPTRRGFMMAFLSSGMFAGSGVSGVLGPALYQMGGITSTGLSSMLLMGLCIAICKLWFSELHTHDVQVA